MEGFDLFFGEFSVNFPDEISVIVFLVFPCFSRVYAQTLIVVVLIVVKNLGFLVITRDHGSFGGCH